MKKDIRYVTKARSDLTLKKSTMSSKKSVAKFLRRWKRFVSIFIMLSLFWKQTLVCLWIIWNRFDIDFSDTFVIRWFAWIRFFDFEIRHVFDIKHTAANDLFKKFSSFNDFKEIVEKKNIDNWVNAQLDYVRVFFVSIDDKFFFYLSFWLFRKVSKNCRLFVHSSKVCWDESERV